MTLAKKKWLWYFGAVAVLSGVAVLLLSRYLRKLAPVVTLDDVAAARAKWRERGPSHYRLQYEVLMNERRTTDQYEVEVNNGKVVRATWNRRNVATLDEKASANALSVVEMFDLMEANLQSDRYSATAYFNEDLGYLSRYVRRERGTKNRLEIRVAKLTPIDPH